ncbi:uncharacterized protein [Clytia hemisphaerica]|uniref:uncharacterized protein n=1 Tax=Clytia hemisphaerica TaxID=252671 RepID=UPI0034D5D75B
MENQSSDEVILVSTDSENSNDALERNEQPKRYVNLEVDLPSFFGTYDSDDSMQSDFLDYAMSLPIDDTTELINDRKLSSIKNIPSEHLMYVKATEYNSKGVLLIDPKKLTCVENDTVVPILMNTPFVFNHLVSTSVPRNVKNNGAFIVDLDKLEDPADVLCDDLGSWKQSKTATKKYQVHRTKSGHVSRISLYDNDADDPSTDMVIVTRRSYVNKSDGTLKRAFVSLSMNNQIHNLVFLSYKFNGPEHEVKVQKHGNSKAPIPFLRTYTSTRRKILKSVKSIPNPSRAHYDVVSSMEEVGALGQLPRNVRQVKYEKSKEKTKTVDPLYQITNAMRNVESNTDRFIRTYQLDDQSMKVILFNDRQIDDIVNFCCNATEDKSLYYSDITFELGSFFLLVSSYKNTALYVKNTESSPAMIGPMMLCLLKDEETYLSLFQKVTAKIQGIRQHLEGYCSDSEKALRNALAREFPRSLAFLCFIHVKKNISMYCNDTLRLSQGLSDVIIDDIFGVDGLVHAESTKAYHERVELLIPKWDDLEKSEKNGKPRFSNYFITHKKEDVLNHTLLENSRKNGFGDCIQTTNLSESINAKIKRWQNFELKDIASFIDDMKSIVQKQQYDVGCAYVGLDSPFILRDVSKKVPVGDGPITPDSIRKASVLVDPAQYKMVKAFQYTAPTASSSSLNECPHQCIDNLSQLFGDKDVSLLKNKAEALQKDGIRPGFNKNELIVKSATDSRNPHIVKVLMSGGISCDRNCLGFGTREICAHTLGVAMKEDIVPRYIHWFMEKKFTGNLTKLTTFNVNPEAGRKKPKRKRNRPKSPDNLHQHQSTSVANKENLVNTLSGVSSTLGNPLGGGSSTLGNALGGGSSTLGKPLSGVSPTLGNALGGGSSTLGNPLSGCTSTLGNPLSGGSSTLGDILCNDEATINNFSVSSNGMKLLFTKNKLPPKPKYVETTTTDFELLQIHGKISVCAGCTGRLNDGPEGKNLVQFDKELCIRHKERDTFLVKGQSPFWKKTFQAKHYHMNEACIRSRNPSFDPSKISLSALPFTLTKSLIDFLRERLF